LDYILAMPRKAPPAASAPRRPARRSSQPGTVHQVKVTLRGVRPPIWRRLQIPSGATLRKLHDALQIAFGWEDAHLHEFRVGARRFGRPDTADGWAEPGGTASEDGTTLGQVARRKGAKLLYVYDFGDSWEHEVVVETILPADSTLRYPRCLDGARAAPPEDCGGAWGYAELLDVLSDPTHEEHAERREWLGAGFDPARFDLVAVDRALGRRR
jgi:hypothetical protein